MININIHHKNVIEFFDKYEGEKFSFALYDPPYEMNIIGNKWDNSGIVFSKEYNDGLFNILKPGAFVLCYGHGRTFHRMMVALEDAGFIVHKTIFGWGYSSGNPQGAANIQRTLDNSFVKKYGGLCECETPVPSDTVVEGYVRPELRGLAIPVQLCDTCNKPIRKIISEVKWGETSGKKNLGGAGYGNNNVQIIAEPMTIEAQLLKPYTYGLASFKPVVEPIILVQKPFEDDKAVESILKYGTGIVNVHETRYIDRWPGNFVAIHELGCQILDGHWECVDGCEIGEQIKSDPDFTTKYPTFAYNELDLALASIDPLVIESKPSKKEKNLKDKDNPHPTVKPIRLNQYLARLFLPPSEFGLPKAFVPFSGSGSEILGLIAGGWEDITGVELSDEFAEFSVERINEYLVKKNEIHYFGEILTDHTEMKL